MEKPAGRPFSNLVFPGERTDVVEHEDERNNCSPSRELAQVLKAKH